MTIIIYIPSICLWIFRSESLRSARVSNEKRLNRMFGLSCSVRRQIAIKAKELGCNAVVGYKQHFDIEGDSGIVSRASGTACRIRTVPIVLYDLNSISPASMTIIHCIVYSCLPNNNELNECYWVQLFYNLLYSNK